MSSTPARRIAALIALCLCTVAAACTGSGDSSDDESGAGSDTTAAPASATPCAPEGDETPTKALLRCGDESVVYLETPYASGTGIVVKQDDERYVATNLHVVDPFTEATVVRSDGEELATLPLVGAEAATDIALLGPIDGDDTTLTPVPLEPVAVDKGDDVFIVGYPGTARADEVDLTITSGLVSRRRDLPEWDQTYVQTDAVVEDGQSGGPMFAADGSLVGMTALAFDESFSLALDTEDVGAAIGRILDDGGDQLTLVPTSADDDPAGGATTGSIELPVDLELPTLYLPASEQARTWNLSATGPEGRFGVTVLDALEGDALAQNAAGAALDDELTAAAAEAAGVAPEEFGAVPPLSPEAAAAEVAPNTFRIEVPADTTVEVRFIVAPDAVPASLTWTSDQPLWALTPPVTIEPLELDEPAELILSSYQLGATFDVELAEGAEVQVVASSPWADIDVVIGAPGVQLSAPLLFSGAEVPGLTLLPDSDVGLYGLDVDEPFTAEAAGTYRVVVQNFDVVTTAARLEVRTES
jgi:hypothetical protein